MSDVYMKDMQDLQNRMFYDLGCFKININQIVKDFRILSDYDFVKGFFTHG